MFSNTLVRSSKKASSVIIKFDEHRGVSELQLPLGLDSFPEDDYGLKKQLFFKTYQTYRKFIREKINATENQKENPIKETIDQDTVTEDSKSYHFKNSQTNESISYQKLVMFDSILNSYDELKIQSLQNKISKSDSIDYSKIHLYLNNAVYLKNNAIYIDSMDLPKNIIKDASTELVELYCYIYAEILKELEIEPDNPLILPLANSFKENRLFEESSLFAEDTYEDTISILKGVLDEIDQTTAYKDFDYWHFYDAVYNFLYSNNDGEWSIDNFSYIWERMCLSFAEKYYDSQIRVYDDFGHLNSKVSSTSFTNLFRVSMNPPDNLKRYIRPDMVLEKETFIIADDFLEKIYNVEILNDIVDLKRIMGSDYRQFGDIESLKIELFGDKPRIKLFYNRTGKYPPTFTLSKEEFLDFKRKSKDLLQNHRSIFDIATRHPNIVADIKKEKTNEYLVVDYKYMTEQAFQIPLNDFVEKAVRKQYVYELALNINIGAKTQSEFWIPGFLTNRSQGINRQVKRYSKNCDNFIKKYNISVFQLDFLELQKIYVGNDIS